MTENSGKELSTLKNKEEWIACQQVTIDRLFNEVVGLEATRDACFGQINNLEDLVQERNVDIMNLVQAGAEASNRNEALEGVLVSLRRDFFSFDGGVRRRIDAVLGLSDAIIPTIVP